MGAESGVGAFALQNWESGFHVDSTASQPAAFRTDLRQQVRAAPSWFRGRQGRRLREMLLAYSFLAPAFIIIGLFGLFPLAFAAYESTLRGLNKIVGSYDGSDNWDSHVGHHPHNFSQEGFDAVVEWVRQVLNEVNPQRTRLTLEMSPWTLLDSPEIYLTLLQTIDHPGLAVHLDPANAVREPRIYYNTAEMINRCFDLLGPWIRSCHAKDVHFALDARTVAIEEVLPGRGVLDYRTYVSRIEQLSPDMPLIIEHLATEPEYKEVSDFIRGVAAEVGATV